MILRGTGLVCIETLFLVTFSGGGSGLPAPPPLWNPPMSCLTFMGLHENSPLRDIKLFGYTVTKTEIYFFFLGRKQAKMSMCIQHCWLYGSIMRGSRNFHPGDGGPIKTLITFFRH